MDKWVCLIRFVRPPLPYSQNWAQIPDSRTELLSDCVVSVLSAFSGISWYFVRYNFMIKKAFRDTTVL